jgi:outer membrane receptor for ferrienterochelin and colicins
VRLACALLVLTALLPAAARADSIADEADFRFHRGATLYRQGNVEEALGEFLASNRLVHNRNVVYNIARSFEQLGRFNEAYRFYTELLADDLPEAERKEIEAGRTRLSPRLALLRVETVPPGATVYVDRRDLGGRGQTPVVLALPAGKVDVMVDLPGYKPAQTSTVLQVGKTISVRPPLERIYGGIVVTGEPQRFELHLDGAREPLLSGNGTAKVIPGRHVVALEARGYAGQQLIIQVQPDEMAPVRFSLSPLPPPSGALIVKSNLDGALVRIDGREAGFTPSVIDNIPAGRHEVQVLSEGREPVIQQLEIHQNERTFVDARLRYTLPRVVAAEKELTRAQDAPASISVISAEEIRGFGYTTLAEALRSVRGLYTSDDRDYQTIGVRGFSSPGTYNARVLVLSDGHVTNESSLGQGYVGHDFSPDLSDVERIEIVRGPGSVLYGSAAFLAVVNVVHRTPLPGTHGSAGGQVGTLGENEGHAAFSVAGETGSLWIGGSGLDATGEAVFVRPGDASQLAQRLDGERAGHVDLRARLGDFSVSASLNQRRKALPTGAFDTIFGAPGTATRDQRGFVEANFNHAFESGLGVDLRVSYDNQRYTGRWQYNGRALGVLGNDTSTEDWGDAELRLRLPALAGHRLFIGGEVQDRWNVSISSYVPPDTAGAGQNLWNNLPGNPGLAPNSGFVFSGYAGDDWRISRRIQLDAAIRVDKFLDSFPAGSTETNVNPIANPRVALILQPYDDGTTKLLFGTAFRYPGFYERYFNDGGVSQVTADRLQPERITTFELEHTHQFTDEVSLLVAANYSVMKNLIDVVAVAGGASQYQNAAAPTHGAGAEAEMRWQGQPGMLFAAWYALGIVRQDPPGTQLFSGTAIPNSPLHTAGVRALYPVVQQALSISTEAIYGSARNTLPDGTTFTIAQVGESVLWNLGVSGETARLRYGAFIYDVLDQKTSLPGGPDIPFPSHAVPQTGRMLRLQLSASF